MYSEYYENLNSKKQPIFKLFVLLASLFCVNYITKFTSLPGSANLIVFIAFELILFILDPLYAFVYSFVLHVDIMSCYNFTWAKLLTLACMYLVFIKNKKSLFDLFQDKRLKKVFFLGLIFSAYVLIINIGFKSDFSTKYILENSGYIFGFLAVLPAYYFTQKQPEILFVSLTVVAAALIFVYYFSMLKGLDFFVLNSGERGTGANIERLAGYDIRQFIVFFTYLIPATILTTKINTIHKYVLLSIGLLSYTVLILAFYRLAMFHVAMGTILSFLFIRKYAATGKILKLAMYLVIIYIFSNFFFSEYLTEVNNLFSATLDYFNGKGNDSSADTRFEYQLPILNGLINDNFWTGIGLIEMKSFMKLDMMGFVDIPILGTMATFGFLGMFLYYIKFISLLSGTANRINNINYFSSEELPFKYYIFLTLKAYLITMVTFRIFYISWELTMDYQQADFGMFAGAYLALNWDAINNE